MTWIERNPDLIQKIRLYISDFQKIKPTLFDYFQGGRKEAFPFEAQSDKGCAILLFYCSLNQNITEEKLIQFLQFLWMEYHTDIFKLNRLPFQNLQEKIASEKRFQKWEILDKTPGILRSVCDFFYAKGPILPWIQSQNDADLSAKILSEEIFLMGKTSSQKFKPRYFLWLITQLPNAKPELFWNSTTQIMITPAQIRFLREFGPLKNKPKMPWVNSLEKSDYCNRFYNFLFPARSWMVYAALNAYLNPLSINRSPLLLSIEKKFQCRELLGGCLNCSMVPFCPGFEEK